MRIKSTDYSQLDQWETYADIDREIVTIGEGIRLLLRNWPNIERGEGKQSSDEEKVLKLLRRRIVLAVTGKRLVLESGQRTRDMDKVSKEKFFQWAISWKDESGRPSQNDPMHEAALKFGVPEPPVEEIQEGMRGVLYLPLCRLEGFGEVYPPQILAIPDKDLRERVERFYLNQVGALEQRILALERENRELKDENVKLRLEVEKTEKRRAMGRRYYDNAKKKAAEAK